MTCTREPERSLDVLARVGAVLLVTSEPDARMPALARLVVESFADLCLIELTDRYGQPSLAAIAHADPCAEARVQAVLRRGEPGEAVTRALAAAGAAHRLALPLVARRRVLGTITYGRAATRERFDVIDESFATELSRRAALAVDGASLLAKSEEQRRWIEHLQNVTAALSAAAAPARVAEVALREGCAALGAESGAVHVTHPDASELRVTWPEGAHAEHDREVTEALVLEGRVLGELTLALPRERRFGADDQGLLAAVAHQATLALERARLLEIEAEGRSAADAANRAKGTFLANMSHEIRTPMNAILGYTQLLQRDVHLSREQRGHLEVIRVSGEHLLSLVNDVLDMSKIELGRPELIITKVDVAALLADVERMFLLRASSKRISFELNCAPEVPEFIACDERKLRQVLINLLGNAVKFTMRGGVTARVSAPIADGGGARLLIAVEDTGPGIDAREMDRLFQPFSQTRVGLAASGGTGLGLALSRGLARLMGGDITVTSQLGRGTVFCLSLPLVPLSPRHEPERREALAGVAPNPPSSSDAPDRAEPSASSFAPLPAALAEPLRGAAGIADFDRLCALIAELPAEHAALAEELGDLARRYAYDAVEALITQVTAVR